MRQSIIKGLPRNSQGEYVIPQTIRDLAAFFKDIQEKRYLADYDCSARFKRSEVLILVGYTRSQIEKFRKLPASDDRRFFLACLWAWKELANR